ncbi:MAG: hypothetical protein NC923_06860, partial [Candidatus Omnitrophica bacterium]|nr:hypothetical protein [Candidatus Omnitrophota bacterium]
MRIAKPSNYRVVSLIVILAIFFLAGCEAFVRKFTRKKQRVEQEMPVITPEEYKGPQMTKEE